MRSGLWVPALALLCALALLAIGAAADPDPPKVDGGTTTFVGDWTVDPGDALTYVNQTIVLDGNLYVEVTGALDLVNCTLVMNSTTPLEHRVLVMPFGRLNLTSGSEVRPGAAGEPWRANVDPDAHLRIEGSTVRGAGADTALGAAGWGLWSAANDTQVNASSFVDCHAGLVLANATSPKVGNSTFSGAAVAGVWVEGGSGAVLSDLDLGGCQVGVWVNGTAGAVLVNCSFGGGGGGGGVRLVGSSVRLVGGSFADVTGPAMWPDANSTASWEVDRPSGLVNSTMDLNGTLAVLSGGTLEVENSTLNVLCRAADGESGIEVMAGGVMNVTSASTVSNGTSPHRFFWRVWSGGSLSLVSSTLTGAGWNDSWPGLELHSSNNTLDRATVTGCHVGITVMALDNAVTALNASHCVVGLLARADRLMVRDMRADNCTGAALELEGTSHVHVGNLTATRCGQAVLLTGHVANVTISKLSGSALGTGVQVLGVASGVHLSDVHLAATAVGLNVSGEVSGLTVTSMTATQLSEAGVYVVCSGSGGDGVSLDGCSINVPGGSYGVLVSRASNVTVNATIVTGPPLVGVRVVGCSQVALGNLTASGSSRSVSLEGLQTDMDLSLSNSWLEGGAQCLFMEVLTGVVVNDTTLANASGDCLWFSRLDDLMLINVNVTGAGGHGLRGGDSTNVSVIGSRFSLSATHLRLDRTRNVTLRSLTLLGGTAGLVLSGGETMTLQDLDVSGPLVGVTVHGAFDVRLERITLSRCAQAAVLIEAGANDGSLSTVVIDSSGDAVRIDGAQTRDNRLVDLTITNCYVGVNATGSGTGNTLEATGVRGLPVGVRLSSSARLDLVNVSFQDCPRAVLCDNTSWLSWRVTDDNVLSNSSATIRGSVTVSADASLHVDDARLELLSDGATLTTVTCLADGTLLLSGGSRVSVASGFGSFAIICNGTLGASSTEIVGGGTTGAIAALAAGGEAASLTNVTFRGCPLALELSVAHPTLNRCTFVDNDGCILFNGTDRPQLRNCTFISKSSTWDVAGPLVGGVQLIDCAFEGGHVGRGGLWLYPDAGESPTVTIRGTSFSNYTHMGLYDSRRGSLVLEDCSLRAANASVGTHTLSNVVVRRASVTMAWLNVSMSPFLVEASSFVNGTLRLLQSPVGGTVRDLTFIGHLDSATPCLVVSGSLNVRVTGVTVRMAALGMRFSDGADAQVEDSSVSNATVTALEVSGASVACEGVRLLALEGTGVRCSMSSSSLVVQNSSIQSAQGRTGLDVDASSSGQVLMVNTTFDQGSVSTVDNGVLEVRWFVGVELRLPWGGSLTRPGLLSVTDARGTEVVNTTFAEGTFTLVQFVETSQDREMRTPHALLVEDQLEGVRFDGNRTVNASGTLVLELVDVVAPTARAGPDVVIDEDQIVQLDASTSSDNDPTFHSGGSYNWTFDEYGKTVSLDGKAISYVFSVPGRYVVTLNVTDEAGNVGTDSLIVHVKDTTAPVIRFGGDVTIDEDVEHVFDASGTTDNDPGFNLTVGTFRWEMALGDGTLIRTGASFSYVFEEPGEYLGMLTVMDAAENVAEETFAVVVLDTTAPFIAGVSDATVFEVTSGLLNASACTDNVGIVSWTWSVVFNGSTTHLLGPNPDHAFDELGEYSVTLELNDAAGNANSTTVTVVYDDVPVLQVPSRVVAMVGVRRTVEMSVYDAWNTGLDLSISQGPAGARIEGPVSGPYLVWTPGTEHADQVVTVEVEVHDGYKASVATVTFHVNPARGAANSAPTILSVPPRGASYATPYIYPVEAQDPDGDVLGYILEDAPEGMTVSSSGTIKWDPPFDQDRTLVLVDVVLRVTDGAAGSNQSWVIRWREPPNQAPDVPFKLQALEVAPREEFYVDLSTYMPDPVSYTVDEDDPVSALEWEVEFDRTLVILLGRERLVFHLQSLDVVASTTINFTVTDPSGAHDTVSMPLEIVEPEKPQDDGGSLGWLAWVALVALVVLGVVLVVARRRGGAPSPAPAVEADEGPGLGPLPEETPESAGALAEALEEEAAIDLFEETEDELDSELDGLLDEVGSFEEMGAGSGAVAEDATVEAPVPVPGGTRVVEEVLEDDRPFALEGVALVGTDGSRLARTGNVEEVIGPHQEAFEQLAASLGDDEHAVMEAEGRRVLVLSSGGAVGACVVRGREDVAFRSLALGLVGALATGEDPLAVTDDLLSAAGKSERADVVRGAWTARLEVTESYRGSMLVLDVKMRNTTEHVLNNVRLDLDYDHDALRLERVAPKALATRDRVSLGNVQPNKSRSLEVHLQPEICMSSTVRLTAVYTDLEGLSVTVPARPVTVAVECPYVEPGTQMDEVRLLELSEEGLGFSGRRVFSHDTSMDRGELFSLASGLVSERGPMKVMEVNEEKLMRSEAWFIGAGEGGSPRVLVRVSSHGADRYLELFVTSDDGPTATGLLTFLAGEVMDSVASQFTGQRFERVRDAATLEDIEAWPTLLDYKIMGA